MELLSLTTFEAVYHSQHAAIERYLYRLTRDRELTADLAQETFTRAWAALQHEERTLSVAYLYRIAWHSVIDLHRRRRIIRHIPFTDLAADAPSGGFDVADTRDATDFPERLAIFDLFRHAWAQLSSQEQQTLVQSTLRPKAGAQTARDKMQVCRARRHLRQLWQQEVAA
jgi:DNA-directed RNA polymerase specialized sigma24 family protein